MHMISKLWRTLRTSMGLVSQSVDTSPTLVMMKNNSFVGKLIIFDSWSLPVQTVLHLSIILCYIYFDQQYSISRAYIKICIIIQFQTLMISNSFLNIKILIFDFQAYGCYPYILDSLQLLYGNALQKSFKTLQCNPKIGYIHFWMSLIGEVVCFV